MMMKDNYCKNFLIGLLCSCTLLISVSTSAQNVTIPRPSQYATITQRVGISDITITYHSPSVSERAIWGGLVPYDQIWRAGANENTTISFTHDAKIEGKDVKAGTYGLFMMPKQDKVLLFLSRYSQSWGTNYPKEDELVLNASVKSQEIPFQEWLSYDFIDRGGNEVTAVLRWEKKQIPFKISFDVPNIVIENMRAELKGPAGFTWRGYSTAAQFCLQNDTNLEEAMAWVDQSITLSKGYTNLVVKAGLLNKKGGVEEAKKVMEEAVPLANPFQLNGYGYQLLNAGDTKGAIAVFERNIKQNPKHQFIWGFTDSLGEAYLKDGNNKMALKYYKEARALAPENQWAQLDGIIAGIKVK